MNIRIGLTILAITSLAGCRSFTYDGPQAGTHLPALSMRLMDTTRFLNTRDLHKKETLIIVYFSPACSHCREETRQIIVNIKLLKDVHFIFLTPDPYPDLAYFYKEFSLQSFPNFTVGQDYNLSFYKYFKPKNIPYMAIYSEEKILHSVIIGTESIQKTITLINENKS
jgi:cytochrome oxidase Cu insertion factor (SCO1/SenC/PrrC family)